MKKENLIIPASILILILFAFLLTNFTLNDSMSGKVTQEQETLDSEIQEETEIQNDLELQSELTIQEEIVFGEDYYNWEMFRNKNGTRYYPYELNASIFNYTWNYQIKGPAYSSDASPVISNGAVFFPGNGYIFGFWLNNKSRIWDHPLQPFGNMRNSPTVEENIIYFSSNKNGAGNLYAYWINQSWNFPYKEKWIFTAGYSSFEYSSPFVGNTSIYVGGSDGYLYSVWKNNGTLKWKYKTLGNGNFKGIQSSPLLVNDSVYFGSQDFGIYSVWAENGTLKWMYPTKAPFREASPVFKDNLIYIGSADSHIYSLWAENGTLNWKYKLNSSIDSSPALDEDFIYIAEKGSAVTENKGVLHSLWAENGTHIWKHTLNYTVLSSPLVTKNLVILPCQDGTVSFINKSNGVLFEYLDIQGGFIGSSPIISNGTLYVNTGNGLREITILFDREQTQPGTDEGQQDFNEQIEEETLENQTENVLYPGEMPLLPNAEQTLENQTETPSTPPTTPSSPSSSSSPSSGGGSTFNKPTFTIEPTEIEINTVRGEQKIFNIVIKNSLVSKKSYSIDIEGSIKEMVSTPRKSIEIPPMNSQSVGFVLDTPFDSGIYAGKINIQSEGKKESALVKITINSLESNREQIIINLSSQEKIEQGSKLNASISLGSIENKNIFYTIKDYEGNIYLNEKIEIGDNKNLHLEVPTENLTKGEYVIAIEMQAEQDSFFESASFKVVKSYFYLYVIIFTFVLILAIGIIIYVLKAKRNTF